MKKFILVIGLIFIFPKIIYSSELKVGVLAPHFVAKTHEGKNFNLSERKGHWTVLYFYPKAETPGCTTQACAFRDSVDIIRAEGADIFGVSADTVEQLAGFHKKHKLNFTLLADPSADIIKLFGSKRQNDFDCDVKYKAVGRSSALRTVPAFLIQSSRHENPACFL